MTKSDDYKSDIIYVTTSLCAPCNACCTNVWLLQCDMRQWCSGVCVWYVSSYDSMTSATRRTHTW